MKNSKKIIFISGIDRDDISSMVSASHVKEMLTNEQLIDDKFQFMSIYTELGNDYFKLNNDQFKERVSSLISGITSQNDIIVLFRSIVQGESDHIELVNIRESWMFIEEIAYSGVCHSIIKNDKYDKFNVMRRFIAEEICQNLLTIVVDIDDMIHFSYVVKTMFNERVVNGIGNEEISHNDVYNNNVNDCFEFLCPFDGFYTRKNQDVFVVSDKFMSCGKLADIEMNEYWFKGSNYSYTKTLELTLENMMSWQNKRYHKIFQAPSGFYKVGECLLKLQSIIE